MNGVDYTKSLAKERDKFYDTLNKNRKSHENEKVHIQDTHDKQRTKQKETFENQRNTMKDNYEKHIDENQESISKALQDKQVKYLNNLNEERKRFEGERADLQKTYDQRMRDVQDEYRRNISNEQQTNQRIQDHKQENYHQKVGDVKNDAEKRVHNFEENALSKIKENELGNAEDRKRLNKAHNIEKQEIMAKNTKDKTELTKKFQDETDNLKRYHDFDTERIEDNTSSQISSMKDKQDKILLDNNEKTKAVVKDITDKSIGQKKENARALSKLQLNHDRQVAKDSYQKDKLADVNKEISEVTNNRLRQSEKDVYQAKQRDYRDQIDRLKEDFSKKSNSSSDQFVSDLKDTKLKSAKQREDMKKDQSLDNLRLKDVESAKRNQQREYYEEKRSFENRNADSTIGHLEQTSKNKERELKRQMVKGLAEAQTKSAEQLQQYQEEIRRDKAAFAKNVRIESHEDRLNMQKTFNDKILRQRIESEKVTDHLKENNSKLNEELNEKVVTLSTKAEQDMQRMKEEFAEQRKGDLLAQKQLIDLRESKFIENLEKMHHEFQKKMDLQQRLADRKLNNLTRMYEGQLEGMSNLLDKTNKEFKIKNQEDRERLISQGEIERNRLVAQYESQILNMKQAYQDQIDTMKSYKDLESNTRMKA